MYYKYVVSFLEKYGNNTLYNLISKDTQYYIGATIKSVDENIIDFETNQVTCRLETSQLSAITLYKDNDVS